MLWLMARGKRPERDWRAEPPETNGEQLRMIRESQKAKTGIAVSQRAAAEIAKLTEANYRQCEYDGRNLKEHEARLLASAWGERWEDFYLRQDNLKHRQSDVSPPGTAQVTPMIEVPLVGSVKAGNWGSPLDASAKEEIPADMWAADVFVCYVYGDSMAPFLEENDVAVFKISRGREQPRDVVYVRNQDDDVTVKQYMHDGVRPFLHPLNRQYPDMFGVSAEDDRWTVEGILVGFTRVDPETGDLIRRHNMHRLRPKKTFFEES